nr:MAG TPA: Putative Fe-S cluster [Caudoviricetes sp.]
MGRDGAKHRPAALRAFGTLLAAASAGASADCAVCGLSGCRTAAANGRRRSDRCDGRGGFE